MSATTVACKNCGLLTLLFRVDGQLVEVEKEHRVDGETPRRLIREGIYSTIAPLCFVMAHDLDREFREEPPKTKAFQAVVQRERSCDKFMEWRQGFTPKEHREMLQTQQQLELQEQRFERAREEERAWRSRESRFRMIEILSVIVLAPLVAWLIPFLAAKFTAPPAAEPAPIKAAE